MISNKNKIFSLRNTLKLFLLYSLSQSCIFGALHKHTEANLHFHSENVITKDHTISPEEDCAICPAILAASIFLIYKTRSYCNYGIFFLGVIFDKTLFRSIKSFGVKLGRAPPQINNL